MDNLSLEGRIVLIAGDSDNSRELRDHISRDLRQDHQVSGRVIHLDVKRKPYSNLDQNFLIKDPTKVLKFEILSSDEKYECCDIEKLIKSGDVYFVSKLENPLLANPLNYVLGPLIEDFGKHYTSLKLQELQKQEFDNRFRSYIQSNLPINLKGLVDKKRINQDLQGISVIIQRIFDFHSEQILEEFVKANHTKKVELSSPNLEMFGFALKGYLHDIMRPRDKQHFLDELRAISNRIGKDILKEDDTGRFNWIVPGLDGRSDHANGDPSECIRAREYARIAQQNNVAFMYLISAHSHEQVNYFTKRGIHVKNITLTNEFISHLAQDPNVNFKRICVLSPDEGGLPDSMVFARELYRRTNGEFNGRVIVFKKEKNAAGKIIGMDLLGSYIYKKDSENPKKDYHFDDKGRPLPYDIYYADVFKDSKNKKYIGNLFEEEFSAADETDLNSIVCDYEAMLRDDLVASGDTLIRASRSGYDKFGLRVRGFIENPSLTGNAIKDLNQLYTDGILKELVTSTSIIHPNKGQRLWHHAMPISGRIKNAIKRNYLDWLKVSHNKIHDRMDRYQVLTI